jgi:hypothetical protein
MDTARLMESEAAWLVAGVMCVVIAMGHAAIGILWVLPRLASDSLPRTPLGSSRMTEMMIRVTWHVVTIFVLALGGVLLSLGWVATSEPMTLVLRWFGTMWLAVVAMALFVLARRGPDLMRRPFSILWTTSLSALGILLWVST